MAAATPQTTPAQVQDTKSKSSKKKAKAGNAAVAAAAAAAPAPAADGSGNEAPSPQQGTSVAGNDSSDNAYIRELKKNIRNTNKKILNASKTESLIAQNKDKTIPQLIAAKIINADQKRQVDNKPALEAELARNEEHLAHVLKLDEEWRTTLAQAQQEVKQTLIEKHEEELAEAIAEVKSQAEAEAKQTLEDGFLILSQFLRLAANRRQEAEFSTEDRDRTTEGILLSVYAGDHSAVDVMLKLYQGTDDTTHYIDGTPLNTTFATIKELAVANAQVAPEDLTEQTTAEAETESAEAPAVDADPNEDVPAESTHLVQTDPTVAHAGLTEIDAGTDTALINGQLEGSSAEADAPIPNADVGDSAANASGEAQWDTGNDLAASQEWVQIPKATEVSQTDTAPNAAAPVSNSNPSWADDQPEPSAAAPTTSDPNDGFQSVQRNRGRGNGEPFRGSRGGHHRGGRGGSGFRGRGRGGGGRPWRESSSEQRPLTQRPAVRKEAQQS